MSGPPHCSVLLQMLQDAVGRRVADVEVVTETGELGVANDRVAPGSNDGSASR